MATRFAYSPPPLTLRIEIRTPAPVADQRRDRYGRLQGSAASGVMVWAHKRDRAPREVVEEAVLTREQLSIFTVRHRDGIAANSEIVYGGSTYEMVGPPVERGGPGFGRASKYLELYAKLRV